MKSRPIVKEIGIGGLYLRHMVPILEHVRKRGLRPILWADIVLSFPEIIAEIPRDVVLMDWDYGITAERGPGLHIHGGGPVDPTTGHRATLWGLTWAEYATYENPAFRKHFARYAVDSQTHADGAFRQFYATDALRDAGFDVITASANRSCGDMKGIPQHGVHLPNCFHFVRKGMRCGCGHLVTSWAVRHNHPEVCWPATFAAVHTLSHNEAFSADSIYEAFTREFYGDVMPEFARAVENAQQGFWIGESRGVLDARRRMRLGEHLMSGILEQLERKHGDRRVAAEYVQAVRAGYVEARNLFRRMKSKAVTSARDLDFWLEGIELQTLYADFLPASLSGSLPASGGELRERIARLRENTRLLFSETYMPQGVADEVEQRYGFLSSYLDTWAGAH